MRSVPSAFKQNTISYGLSVSARKNRPQFTKHTINENNTASSYDDDIYDGKLLRVAANNFTLPTKIQVSYVAPADSGWMIPSWTDYWTAQFNDQALYVSVYENAIFIATSDGKLFRGLYPAAPSLYKNISANTRAIAAVSSTEVYALEYSNVDSYGFDITFHTQSTADNFPGQLSDGKEYPYSFTAFKIDAVRHDGNDYVYVLDGYGDKTFYLKHRVGGSWGKFKPVIPTDYTDDENFFSLTGVSVVNNQVVVAGVLSRKYAGKFMAYLFGPEHFTMGRDFLAGPLDSAVFYKRAYGKMYNFGSETWIVGHYCRYSSEKEPIFGGTRAYTEIPSIERFGGRIASNMPSDIGIDQTQTSVNPGDEALVTISADGNGVSFQCGVNSVNESNDEDGKQTKINLSTLAMKKLSDWKSDAYYEYVSQEHSFSQAEDMAKLIRHTGRWEDNSGFGPANLNVDSFLYSSLPASNGGIIKQKFTRNQHTIFGVGMNYGEETLAETAERLGKSLEDVSASERRKIGVFAIYIPGELVGLEGMDRIMIRTYDNQNPYQLLWQMPDYVDTEFPVPDGQEFWLGMRYNDGFAEALLSPFPITDPGVEAEWMTVLSAWTYPHIKRVGRAAVYARHQTPNGLCYPFSSDSNIIPLYTHDDVMAIGKAPLVDQINAFPSSGTIVVDDEQITYGEFKTLATALHADVYRGEKVFGVDDFSSLAGGETAFGYSGRMIVQPFMVDSNTTITSMRLRLRKSGSAPLRVMLMQNTQDPLASLSPLGDVAAYVDIESQDIDTSSGIVDITFDKPVSLKTGQHFLVFGKAYGNTGTSQFYAPKSGSFTIGSAYSAYLYLESDKSMTTTGSPVCFELYSGPTDNAIVVSSSAGTGTTYNNCALVVESGGGKNSCFRVVSHEVISSKTYFYVDPSPSGKIDATSQIVVVPALLKLTRGELPAAHSDKGLVSLHSELPLGTLGMCEVYTNNEDFPISEIAEEIARKAGVEFTTPNIITNPIVGFESNHFSFRNFIADIDFYGNDLYLWFRKGAKSNAVYIHGSSISLINDGDNFHRIPPIYNPSGASGISGKIRVSISDHISVWVNGRLEAAFRNVVSGEGEAYITGSWDTPPNVVITEMPKRINWFSIEMGQSGLEAMSRLVGQKRVFFQDDGTGKLRLFANRPLHNTELTPETRVTSVLRARNDGAPTRIMLEGAEIAEVSDTGTDGNLFQLVHMDEINTLDDLAYFGNILKEDIELNKRRVQITMPLDPSYEPGDEAWFSLPEATKVVIDGISYEVSITEDGIQSDMVIDGREYADA